jgi:hypothetical protein
LAFVYLPSKVTAFVSVPLVAVKPALAAATIPTFVAATVQTSNNIQIDTTNFIFIFLESPDFVNDSSHIYSLGLKALA